MIAEILSERCPVQKDLCEPLKKCPQSAIRYIKDSDALMGATMIVIKENCDGCGICIELCCGHAIELKN